MTPEPFTALGPGAEFDLIRELGAVWGRRAQDLGDDAAVIPLAPGRNMIVSTDVSVEHVHFERDWITPEEIGYRAAAAALSDLAAMAAEPLGVLTAIAVPDSWRAAVTSLATGLGAAAAENGARVIGGDLSRGSELSLAMTVIGWAAEPLRRSGAQPGDSVYVTGRFGGPGAAVNALRSGCALPPEWRDRFVHPRPRIREARWVAARGASAAIDVSDGLASDLRHLAAASRVAIDVDIARLPCVAGVAPLAALASGEEYELLFTCGRPIEIAEFVADFGVELTKIGYVGERGSGEVTVRDGGQVVAPSRGYDHFSR